MEKETRNCQNCKTDFVIEPEDFAFYQKIDVPPPTWCPQCRMVRRFIFRNEHNLYRRPDSHTGEDIFSTVPKESDAKVYERSFWWSDGWNPLDYGRDIDWNRPFLEQLKELMYEVPWPSRSALNLVNSDYCANLNGGKNSYLCFHGFDIENSAYVIGFSSVKEGFDLYQSRHAELCYDNYMADEVQRVFFSTNVEESHDIWFSKNIIGCNNIFGSINLRNKSYYIFNKPVSKEQHKQFMTEFNSGLFKSVEEMRQKAEELWLQHPNRFTLAINVIDSTGEHIEHCKNVKDSYFIHNGEDMKHCQMIEDAKDCYDLSIVGRKSELMYDSMVAGVEAQNIKFSFNCVESISNLEYCVMCFGTANAFGCVGLKKGEYAILNKKYSKEEYKELVIKLKQHMNDLPYTDGQGRVYKYGEFLPAEFSPLAYNESLAQTFFPLTKEEAVAQGYQWRDEERRQIEPTIQAGDLPDNIADVQDDVLKQIIGCQTCGAAFRIIPMELDFYRNIKLPIPRRCPDCRFARRFRFVNPPVFRLSKCHCSGAKDASGQYANQVAHSHGDQPCPNEFETSFREEAKEIIYCEQCYKSETI
ncbi:MAG: hypothetical protein COU11_02860 [Candidatus Harrisonbacteria bacterium CG10_big_fil_rev_8_21_14_0_10_49_15]|uniref:Uncharacterized protein n=1 Tax=Candidatus Harrisonbacteria bacterium CG10_big_fil_rev_8_21_14_0_10_49_15 TaxID=1974587 RepID=A0A2H0UKK7_9BACT|nr:MAG: hypothetical protein COU11_02860 [Candidatus Harrisonbacteria bacterium CG10_big_fil_rev_8_21_14_0_10_49_15]